MSEIHPSNATNQPSATNQPNATNQPVAPTPAPAPDASRPAAPYPYPQPYQQAQAYPQPYQQPHPQPYPQPYAPYYGYYPAYAWAPPAPAAPTPAERASKPGVARVRNLILALVISLLTLGAIGLGAGAALTGQSAPAPTGGGLHPVYDSALSPNEVANWALTPGCALDDGGLHVTGGSDTGVSCAFQPSTNNDLLSQGFYLATTLAPSGQVASQEAEAIDLALSDGSVVELQFVQDGTYALDMIQSDGTGSRLNSGVTIAWHADGFETNTVVVNYVAATQTLSAYVNGQNVLSESLQFQLDSGASLGLGAPSNTEALFTHFTLYSTSSSSN